jgi:hypothetical protein
MSSPGKKSFSKTFVRLLLGESTATAPQLVQAATPRSLLTTL